MPKIVFIESDGRERELDAIAGQTVMQVATGAMVRGVVAECGGNGACATCHVYVDPAWFGRLPAAAANERELLECSFSAMDNSRLACQILVTDGLDGLVVRVPPSSL